MGTHRIESPVTGKVWKLERQVGDVVAAGDTLVIVESMKMEIPVDATASGTLTEMRVGEGETVEENQVLVVVVS